MMRHRVLILVAATLCVGRIGMCTDNLAHVETVGYTNVPVAEHEPKEGLLRSLEVVCRLNTPAQCTAVAGKETIRLKVLLRSAKETDTFSVDVDYECAVDTGNTIPDGTGRRKNCPELTGAATKTMARLNEQVVLGGMTSSKTEPVGKQRVTSVSKQITRLLITEFKPQTNETTATRSILRHRK